MEMSEELQPDASPDPEALRLIAQLSAADLERIDEALLAEASRNWRKTARVVGFAMLKLKLHGIPDVFFAERVKLLAERGKLLSEGNLCFMRHSEVRIPGD